MTNVVRIVVNISDLVHVVQDLDPIQFRYDMTLFIDWLKKNAYLHDENTFQWVITMDSAAGRIAREDECRFELPSGYRFGESSYLVLPGFSAKDIRRKLVDHFTTAGFSDICFLIKTHKRDDTIDRVLSKPLTAEGVKHVLYFDWPDHRDEETRRLLEIPGKTKDIQVYQPGFLVPLPLEPTPVPAQISLYVDVDETLMFTQLNQWHQDLRIEHVRQSLDALPLNHYPRNVQNAISMLRAILSEKTLWKNELTLPLLSEAIYTLENALSKGIAPSESDALIHCLQTLRARVWNHGVVDTIAKRYLIPDTPAYFTILTSRSFVEHIETHPLMPTAAAHLIEKAHKVLEPLITGRGARAVFLNGFEHFCRNPEDIPRRPKDPTFGDHVMLKLGYVIAAQILAFLENPDPAGLRQVYVIDDQIAQIHPFFTDDINAYLRSNGYPIQYIPILCTTKLALEEPINLAEQLSTAEALRHKYFCKHCEPLTMVTYMLDIYPTIKARDVSGNLERHVQTTYQLACKFASLARWLQYSGSDKEPFPEIDLEEPLLRYTKRAYESPVIKKTADFHADFQRSMQHAAEVINKQMSTPHTFKFGEYAPHTLFHQRPFSDAELPTPDDAIKAFYTISRTEQ